MYWKYVSVLPLNFLQMQAYSSYLMKLNLLIISSQWIFQLHDAYFNHWSLHAFLASFEFIKPIGPLMYTHFYSCRYLLGLQVQRFVEQQQVYLKWITQGLSNSGRKRSKLSLSSNPAITIQKVSCVPNTPNTLFRCIGALVRQRDSEIQVV
jgi:hypothetical protein